MSNILEESTKLKSDIDELLIPVNELLKKARSLGLSFNINEGYNSKKDSPTVRVYMSIPVPYTNE